MCLLCVCMCVCICVCTCGCIYVVVFVFWLYLIGLMPNAQEMRKYKKNVFKHDKKGLLEPGTNLLTIHLLNDDPHNRKNYLIKNY